MHHVEEETFTAEEIKKKEAIIESPELIKNSLKELQELLERSEEYVQKVIVALNCIIEWENSGEMGNWDCTS